MSNHAWPDGILSVSREVGLTPSILRIWEERYHWPKPARNPNGYRAYSAEDIRQLKAVAALVKAGRPIGSIIISGIPRL